MPTGRSRWGSWWKARESTPWKTLNSSVRDSRGGKSLSKMKTILPTPPRPFNEDEIKLLTERLELIEQALEEKKIVVATRPNQITGSPTNKVLKEIRFYPDTDADLVTASGGALNLFDPTYEFASYKPDKMPEDISEEMCLAHLSTEVGKALLQSIQTSTKP